MAYLWEIQHRNLVTLLGYCQESGSQILVYEYLPNGSVCNHLYGMNPSEIIWSFDVLSMDANLVYTNLSTGQVHLLN